jgi:hypothetical protein
LRQVDGPLDTTSESEKSEDSFERRKKNRVDSQDVDPSFFETMEKIEEELGKESQDKTVYLGCLRNENAANALPYGHLVMIDSDDLNVMKKELPENYVYLKMMRKEVDGEKKIVPVCLKCNEKSVTEALMKGTNKNIKGAVLEETLVKCKHAAVSKAVYYHKNVLNVENKSTNCTVLKNTKTLHMAACYDGISFATIVCRIGRHSTKGKCVKCKGDRCGHNNAWNKELGSAVLKKRKRKEEESEYMSKPEDTEDNEDEEEKVKRGQLKFPPTKATQAMFRKFATMEYNEKEHFVDEPNESLRCKTHNNLFSTEDPIINNWWFSNKVKIAHSNFVTDKTRKVYYRIAAGCDCKLMYEGEEDFMVRIGGSTDKKYKNRPVTLISYGLLIDFTLAFMENGQTISGFFKLYKSQNRRKYGMEEEYDKHDFMEESCVYLLVRCCKA